MLATIQHELPALTAAVARREGHDATGAAEPWPGYDKQTTDENIAKVARFDAEVRAQVARYERDHKRRQTVIEAATREPAAA